MLMSGALTNFAQVLLGARKLKVGLELGEPSRGSSRGWSTGPAGCSRWLGAKYRE